MVAIAKNFSEWSLYYLMDSLPRRWCFSMRNSVLWGHIHCHIWSYQKSLCCLEAFRLWWWIHVFVDSNVGFRTFHFLFQQKLSVLSFEMTDLLPQFSRKQSQAQHWIAFVFSVSHTLKRHWLHFMRKRSSLVQTSLLESFGSLKELVLQSALFITVNTNEAYS